MDIQLRDYQKKFISDIQAQFANGINSVVGVAPCGAGKTVMAAAIVKSAIERGENVLFFVHRKELIDQTANTFCRFGIPFGIISAGNKPNYNLPVQIASVQTLVNRLSQIHKPNLLICDECHHILADSYLKIIKRFSTSKLLGLTATPQRKGGIRLGDAFDKMVFAPSIKELIKLGNLADFQYFAPNLNIDVSQLHTIHGDYSNDELAELMGKSKIIADTVENYIKFANGKSAICYCVNVNHSKLVADKFNSAGIPAAQCDGTTDKVLRQKMVDDFRRGKTKILCNAELFGEGFDVPNMDAVILARPTKSLTLFIQQSMRAMRPDPLNPDKVATIVDCADNISRFGLPDESREYSLKTNTKKENESKTPNFKICPNCRKVLPIFARECSCGFKFKNQPQEIVEKKSDVAKIPEGIRGYLIVAKKRGYKKGWAAYQVLDDITNKYSDAQFKKNAYKDLLQTAKIVGFNKGWAWHKYNEAKEKRCSLS